MDMSPVIRDFLLLHCINKAIHWVQVYNIQKDTSRKQQIQMRNCKSMSKCQITCYYLFLLFWSTLFIHYIISTVCS